MLKPLTDKELKWLNGFLLQRIDNDINAGGRDAGITDVFGLDGLFTAIVSQPGPVPPAMWVPLIWGDFNPIWSGQQQYDTVLSLMTRHMDCVAALLDKQPQVFEAWFLEQDIDNKGGQMITVWCQGFMRGLELQNNHWPVDDIDVEVLLVPIKVIASAEGRKVIAGLGHTEVRNIQSAASRNVVAIYAYSQACR